MKHIVYPAVLYYYKDEDIYTVAFHDINLFTEGTTIEDAFIKSKPFLEAYCNCAMSVNGSLETPRTYLDTVKKYPKNIVLLIDTEIDEKKVSANSGDDMFN